MSIQRFALVIATALMLLSAGQANAQTNRGGIAGTILDPSGAPIPNAVVKVTNIATNQTITLTASEDGRYNATLLEPVIYRITVEAPGFKQALLDGVKVDTSTIVTANITLQPGQVNESVTVTAEAVSLNAENGTVGRTVTQRQITDIPLADRSVLNLLLTLPDVTGDLISETPGIGTGILTPGQGLSIGGARPGSSSFLADGLNNTSSGTGRTVASFSPDTVQEFNVQTSNYSAEYGQSTGGVINVTTKSGGNQFHGSAYYFKKDPSVSAAPFTIAATNRPVSNTLQQEAGFTIGGPIWLPKTVFGPLGYNGKDRTFFFFAFEPKRVSDSSLMFNLFPTTAMRKGDFNNVVPVAGGFTTADVASRLNIPITGDGAIYQVFTQSGNQLLRLPGPAGTATYAPFPGNIIPQNMLDQTALKLLQYLPEPNRDPFINPGGGLSNWVGVRNVAARDNRYQFRIDHQISQANRLTLRHSHIPINGYRGRLDFSLSSDEVNALISDLGVSNQWVATDTQIFSPTAVNELRLGYSRGDFSRVNPPKWQTENLATQLGLPSVTEAGLPWFQFQNPNLFSGIGQEQISLLGAEVDESFQIADTFTKTRGNQTWKFGADLRHARLKTAPVQRAAGGEYSFTGTPTSSRGTGANSAGGNAFASFLLGVPNSYSYRTAVLPYYYRWASAAAFFQNDWKVRPNLTVNLGMRYALQIPRWEKYDRQGVFLPELASDQPLTDAQRRAIATAIGIATTDSIPDNVPTIAKIPPFGFSGRGGRSRYIMPIDWNGWEPRFGFAWVPTWRGLHNRLAIRGGYGLSHAPLTGLGSAPSPDFAAGTGSAVNFNSATTAFPQGQGQCNTAFNVRLSSDPPCVIALNPDQVIGAIPENGLIYSGSIKYGGFAISPNVKTPRSETWNLTTAWEIGKGTVLEVSYTGNRGSHLFLAPPNLNLVPFNVTQEILGRGLDPASTVNDPLGRVNLSGGLITTPRGSLLAPYLGFTGLNVVMDSRGTSIRHAGSAYLRGRFNRWGLAYTAAYTFGKSIDTASDAGGSAVPNINASRSDGYVRYGAPLELDRSVSAFDMTHWIAGTFLWDLPVGNGGMLWANPPAVVNHLIGGFTLSGAWRIISSYPFGAFVQGNNGLDNQSGGSVRMNLNPDPNVPILNPLYDPSCPIGTTCQPYINPAAWIRPPQGQFGAGPRTYGNIRSPMRKYLDLSVQKNFYVFGKDRKKYLQFRIDAINALNHPNFTFASIGSGTGFTSGRGPNSNAATNNAVISPAEYDAWVAFDSSRAGLARTTPLGAQTFAQVQGIVTSNRIGTGNLPANFYSVPVPTGFTQIPLNSFDIRTLEGYKLYRLSQSWDKSFGTLALVNEQPRKIQWAVKFIF